MEGIKEKINADFIEAFKSKDSVKKNLLGVIRGEIQTKEKAPGATQLTDAEVMAVISKSYKNITETLGQVGSNAELEAEAKILEAYLPKQLTIEEISSELVNIVVEVGATGADGLRSCTVGNFSNSLGSIFLISPLCVTILSSLDGITWKNTLSVLGSSTLPIRITICPAGNFKPDFFINSRPSGVILPSLSKRLITPVPLTL